MCLFVINDVIITFFEEKVGKSLEVKKKVVPLHPQSRNKPRIRNAQMAESVDALVSNTSGFTSIPVRPRVWVQEKEKVRKAFSFFMYKLKPSSELQTFCMTEGYDEVPV